MWIRATIALSIAVSVLTISTRVSAQRTLAFRWGMDALVFASSSTSVDHTDGDVTTSTNEAMFSLASPRLGVVAGFVVSDALTIGARIGMTAGSAETEVETAGMTGSPAEASATEVVFSPFAEFLMLQDSTVRPAVGGSVGVESASVEASDGSKVSRLNPIVGGMFNLHIFAADSFTISPYLFVDYTFGTVEDETATEADFSRVRFGLGIGLHGWLWGREPDADDVAPDEAATTDGSATTATHRAEPSMAADGRLTLTLDLPNATLELAGRPTDGGNSVARA